MANPTGAFGFRPIKRLDGAPYVASLVDCYVSSAYATALYIGDPVILSPTTAQKHAVAGLGEGLQPTINLAQIDGGGDANDVVYGVIVGFKPLYSDLNKIYNPASTERIARVVRATPELVFEVRGNGGGTPVAAWVGMNAVGVNGGGSTATGLSGFMLDEGSATAPNTTQAFPLNIVAASSKPGETPLDDYTLWHVVFNTGYNTTGLRLGVQGS